MNPNLLSADAHDVSKNDKFRFGNMRRVVGFAWPYRKTLTIGLLATLVFASVHTVSIGAAFPIFSVLLESEGLDVWANRTIAEQRMETKFEPLDPDKDTKLLLRKVSKKSNLANREVKALAEITDPKGRSPAELLRWIASAPPGSTVKIDFQNAKNMAASERIEVALHDAEFSMKMLRWGSSLIPQNAQGDKLATLTALLVALVVTVLVGNIFRYMGEVLIARSVLRAMMDLRSQLYEHTLCLPMSFFAGRPTADLVTRFVQDIQEIQRGMLTLFGKFVREPMRAIFILAWAFALDWRITLAMCVVVPCAIVIFLVIGRSVKKANKSLLQAYGHMIGTLTTSLQSLRVVKAYTAESHEQKRLQAVDWRMFNQQLKLAKLQAFVSPLIETLAVVAGSFATVWLASRVLTHELTVAKFISLGFTLSVLFDPLRKLTDVYVRLKRSTAGAERIFQVLDQPIESNPDAGDQALPELTKSIEFKDVWYTYPNAERPALQNVSLSIKQGETVAIVGPNGCGKTTLVSLLPRFFDPDRGEILFDEADIRSADLRSLRRQISVVSQDAVVFAGTPTENIMYGSDAPDPALAEDAAKRASADEFIRGIPQGYSADLGERGTTLSGGQRQRLAIARAVFRNAPILIFDEATSQIDSESELKIQTALQEFAKGHTTIIIAHRLSTIQFADRIVVMQAGRVLDTGSHAELIERCSLYRTLCETQFGGELR